MTARGGAIRLGVLLLFVAGSPRLEAQARGAELFSTAVESYRAGRYAEAQRLLREYVEAFADRGGEGSVNLGEAYHYLGLMTPDARLAEGYFLAVAQRYPTSPVADEALVRLGQLYAAQGDYTQAREHWRTLAREYPLSRYGPEAALRVGETYFAEAQWERAYEAFSDGFRRMKDYQRRGGGGANLRDLEGEYVYWIGRTLLARGAHGDARKYLNLVLLDYPSHPLEPLALYHLAESYRADGDEREAQDAWRRFSESVRNTSLEPIAADPRLLEVARARDRGELGPRPSRQSEEEGGPRGEEAARTAGAADESREEIRAEQPALEGAAGGEDDAGLREERAPDAGAPGMLGRPSDDEGLRAPEPGRAGGVVPAAPVGRKVEEAEEAPEGDIDAERRSAEGAAVAEGAAPAQPRREGRDILPAGERERLARERGPGVEPTTEVAPPRRVERAEEPGGELAETEARTEPSRTEVEPRRTPPTAAEAPRVSETERIPPSRTPSAVEAAVVPADAGEVAIPPGLYFVQVGAFTNASAAGKLSTELRKKRFEPSIHSGLVRGQGYYRVRFGPYELPRDRAVLDSTRADLNRAGYPSVLMKQEPVQ